MIDGVETRTLQVNTDERGHLVEIFHEDWELYDPAMSYYLLTARESVLRPSEATVEGRA